MRALSYFGMAVAACAMALIVVMTRDPGDDWIIRAEQVTLMQVDGVDRKAATLLFEHEDDGIKARVFASVPAADCIAGEGTVTLHFEDGSDSEPFHWEHGKHRTAERCAQAICGAELDRGAFRRMGTPL